VLNGIVKAGTSGYTFLGETTSNDGDASGNHGGRDIWVVNVDAAGNIVWQRCYGGSANESASDIEYLSNAGYLLLGRPRSINGDLNSSSQDKISWLIRTNLTGNILWQNTYEYANPLGESFYGQKYIPVGIVRDNDRYGILSTDEADYGIGFGSTRRHARALMMYFNPNTGITIGSGLLNDRPSEYTNETDGSKGAVQLKDRQGGGYILVEDYVGCFFMDNSGWAFPGDTKKTGITYGRMTGASPTRNLAMIRANCNNTFYPNQTSNGNYLTGDVVSMSENSFLASGSTNDITRNPNYGGYDAYISNVRGSFVSNPHDTHYFGGSGSESFNMLDKIDDLNYYACGYTTSNNGSVSGNHGGDEIWHTRIKLNYNTIKGTVYIDVNGNGTKEPSEPWADGRMVSSKQTNGLEVISEVANGGFKNFVGTGAYSTKPVNINSNFTIVPPFFNSNFTGYNNTDSVGFALRPVGQIKDLACQLIALSPARPGFKTDYKIAYQNNGTEIINPAIISFIKDSRTSLFSSSLGGYTTIGDTIRWNLGSVPLFSNGEINITLQVLPPPAVVIGDTLKSSVTIDPVTGDQLPTDNTSRLQQVVRGSFDPNDKRETHGGFASKTKLLNGETLNYTIRFQNTGTDTAFNIYIRDNLPQLLDATTLDIIAASHPYTMSYEIPFPNAPGGGLLTFRFNNILLPDSTTNEPGSHGFISFSIKAKNNITVNDQVLNSASIYFDYNTSISTNTEKTIIRGIPSPNISVISLACALDTNMYIGNVRNPGNNNVTAFLDNNPLVYRPADSTFIFSLFGAPGNHVIKVVFTGDENEQDSTLKNIIVYSGVKPVITNRDTTLCLTSPPLLLTGQYIHQWIIPYTSGSVSCFDNCSFNPQLAGTGTHRIIASYNSGFPCNYRYDTLFITVLNAEIPVIANPDQTVCKLSSPISLQANISVTWSGNGVTGSTFSPSVAGPGIHKIIATKTNDGCPDGKDTLTIKVDDFIQAVITNPDATVCKLSSPINLQANTSVVWNGNGVVGTVFNPAVAGVGVHKIIATKTNGTCPDSKDTLTITVDDFVQAVISNPDATVCKLSAPINLQANTSVVWNGNGVAGSIFNPSVAGVGVHKIIATKTNGTCPDSKDTLTITVDDFVQVVISTPDQTVCKTPTPINLQANTNVIWNGNGVAGTVFNPAIAGVGVHKIIATRINGTCPDTKDTLTITVDDFIKPVILNNDTTVCILASSFNLRSDITVTWTGNGVSGSSFNPATATPGTHLIFAIKTNSSCPDGRDTLSVIVKPLLTPDVNITASQNTISNATEFSNLNAVNASGGGTAPLYTFAKDRNFTQILQAESAINTFRVLPQMLAIGVNTLYARMKSNDDCVTASTAIDSIQITLNISTPPKSELEKALKVFPNPNDGLFSFRFETGINDNLSVTVYDAVGKQVHHAEYGKVGQYNFSRSLDLRNRHKGNYVLLFNVGTIRITRRVGLLR
jgi:uncharacterized repeat protein (TIGR01451 family)